MPYKFDAQGQIVLQEVNGQKLPVFVHPDGKEAPLDGDATVATIGRLNGEAKGHRERAEAAESALKPFKDAGITDPAAAAKALSTVANLDAKKLVDAGEIEKVKNEAIQAVEAKYAPIVKEAETLKGQLNTHLIGGAFSGSKFVAEKFAAEGPAGVEIARALFGQSFKVEDGKVVAYGKDGNRLMSTSRVGEYATPEEALHILVDTHSQKDMILKATGASGSGNTGGAGGRGGNAKISRLEFEKLPPAKQAEISTKIQAGEMSLT